MGTTSHGLPPKKYTGMKSRETLMTILTNGIEGWFDDKPLDPMVYPINFHHLIWQQNANSLMADL
jgi:hypothetical protein